ncbi:MAG: thermonuclease family protein [Clostridia bacterium]|nr:thermonuclease family protein [Clostridia bacterium]
MKKTLKTYLALALVCMLLISIAPVGLADKAADYAASIQLNMGSETVKQQVTVKTFIDGDTVHFFVPETVVPSGVLKARFLAVNTPETTGLVEEYGKRASRFTREKLSGAESIIIESDDDRWNLDSTGDRYLVWVWYKPAGANEYRNLNIELLQNGLAKANSSAQNRYGSICTAAIQQAKDQKLSIYSGEKDPDFYYGDAVEMTVKELRVNPEKYNGVKVAFNGIIAINSDNSVYVEEYDAETDMYYGMAVYYGYGLNGAGLEILKVGNEARIVGTLQYYEAGGTWQVSGLSYRMMRPDDPGNIQLLSQGHESAYVLTEADTFLNGKVKLETEAGMEERPYAEMAMSTSISMKDLVVKEIYTTTDASSSSQGAMTMTCEQNGAVVTVRTGVLMDENFKLITQDAYLGKTVDIKGVVDYFDGEYQIKVFSARNITVHE